MPPATRVRWLRILSSGSESVTLAAGSSWTVTSAALPLKEWTLSAMLQSDLFHRGVPWARLILERRHAPTTLNLAWRHRFSALAYLGLVVAPLAAPRLGTRRTVATGSMLVVTTVALNHRFYTVLLRRGGPGLFLTGLVLHGADHLAGVAAVPVALAGHVS